MQHHAPHPRAAFEGYYTRFDLPSGASLALIISSVPHGRSRPHMVSFTYAPRHTTQVYQRELWVDDIRRTQSGLGRGFELQIPGIGTVRVHQEGTTEYNLACAAFTFRAQTTGSTPWPSGSRTPEGLLARLPLPLHWHVHSLCSPCTFALSLSSSPLLSPQDAHGAALAHQEKNWGRSFPSAHLWLQARNPRSASAGTGACGGEMQSALSCAGGATLATHAFLACYVSPTVTLTFRPPFSMSVSLPWPFARRHMQISPFLSHSISYSTRTASITLRKPGWKLCIQASAPADSIFGLAAPVPMGHSVGALGESLSGVIEMEVWRKKGWWRRGWELVREERFEGAAVEFGGDWFGPIEEDRTREREEVQPTSTSSGDGSDT